VTVRDSYITTVCCGSEHSGDVTLASNICTLGVQACNQCLSVSVWHYVPISRHVVIDTA